MPAKAGIQYAAAHPRITTASDYWIARSSRAMTAEFVTAAA
jgi:hypothetical protein